MGEWRVDRFREEGPEGQKGAAGPGRAKAGTARTRREPVSEGRWMCARRGSCPRTEGCAWRRGRVPAGAPGLGPETSAPLSRTQTPSRSSAGGSRASRSPRSRGPPSSPEAGPGERVAEGARPVTQPSSTNVSGRGRRAGYSQAPSLEARARAGARAGRGDHPPPRPPGVHARPAGPPHVRAGSAPPAPVPAASGSGRPAAPGVAHRAPALQRHVLPEQQLQLVQEAHGGAALRPPPRCGPLLCAPRRPPPAALLGIARAGRGLEPPGPARRWLRLGGRGGSDSHRPPPAPCLRRPRLKGPPGALRTSPDPGRLPTGVWAVPGALTRHERLSGCPPPSRR